MSLETKHAIYFQSAHRMDLLDDESVDLVVTSPPYPMIAMWDAIFAEQDGELVHAMKQENWNQAFERMHALLDRVWEQCYRVMKKGSFLCINIGEATRTTSDHFSLYRNSARIADACQKLGFISLPDIIWRKTTNAPNKFMGSGMLPCGAYVTLEHEWILIFRKGGKREFSRAADKSSRKKSAYFWEERNQWFSDLWSIPGTKQAIEKSGTRERNGSFPLEIPYRLLLMYSLQGDTVLDPFAGLGTTMLAAMVTERNSVGYEIDATLSHLIKERIENVSIAEINSMLQGRLSKHISLMTEREKEGKVVKYYNEKLNCKVMTQQETNIEIHPLRSIVFESSHCQNNWYVRYESQSLESKSSIWI